ncbi:MAG: reprolysin-like metallopeptidase, partial [Actinomycetes bacterium]
MIGVRRPHVARSLVLGVSAGVAISILAWPTGAAADDEVSAGETVVGELVQVWPEYEDLEDTAEHADDGPLSYLRTDSGEAVRLDSDDVEEIAAGSIVEVTVGREITDTASAEAGFAEARNVLEAEVLEASPEPPAQTAPAALPYTNSVTVAMVAPAGGSRDSTTVDKVVTAVNGPVADFWDEQTDGRIRIGVTASHDWISTTAGCSDPYALWTEVARKVGFTRGAGKHLLLYVTGTPSNLAGCSYGLAEVGSAPSVGGYSYVRDVHTPLVAHELGHNFGLGHSSAAQCFQPGYSGGCWTYAYRDFYDVMG